MKRKIVIIGTSAFESWNTAEASGNKDILGFLNMGVLMAVVTDKKVKVFGYDTKGTLRSKCWELVKSYSTITNLEEFMKLKAEEARGILCEYFENVDVEIDIVKEEKIPA